MKKNIVIITCLLLLMLLYPTTLSSSNKTTIYVDDDNTEGPWDGTLEHPFQYIQDGIKASSDGDSVCVFNGFYNEDVVVDKNILLYGHTRYRTVLNGSRNKPVILIQAGLESVEIFGFVIQNGSPGILTNVNKGVQIESNIIQNCVSGIFAYNTKDIRIYDNLIQNCTNVGIEIQEGKRANIHNNYLFNASVGIEIYHSFSADIYKNEMKDHTTGLKFTYADASHCSYNILKNNRWNLWLYFESNNNTITNNQIINASKFGVAISPESCNNNILYHNVFIGNKIHAYDEGYNTWYKDNLSGGNFWDDYKGTDDDGDGIGETPYIINGTGNQDNYPFIDEYGWINVELGIEGGTSLKFTVVNNGYEVVDYEIEYYMHRLVLPTNVGGIGGGPTVPGGKSVLEHNVSEVGFWSLEGKISVCNRVLEKKGLVLLGYVILFEKSDEDYWFFDGIKKIC